MRWLFGPNLQEQQHQCQVAAASWETRDKSITDTLSGTCEHLTQHAKSRQDTYVHMYPTQKHILAGYHSNQHSNTHTTTGRQPYLSLTMDSMALWHSILSMCLISELSVKEHLVPEHTTSKGPPSEIDNLTTRPQVLCNHTNMKVSTQCGNNSLTGPAGILCKAYYISTPLAACSQTHFEIHTLEWDTPMASVRILIP